jgi:hypothetical protein
MKNSATNLFDSPPDVFFILVIVMAAGLGIYGLVILFNLNKQPGFGAPDHQVDRLLVGSMNLTLSLVAIFIVISMMKVDNNQVFADTNKILQQIK